MKLLAEDSDYGVVMTAHRNDRLGQIWEPQLLLPACYYVRDLVVHTCHLVGQTEFYNGVAEGGDLIFAAGVLMARDLGAPARLVAAVPFECRDPSGRVVHKDTDAFRNKQAIKWHDQVLARADEVHIISDKPYEYKDRNWWMSKQPRERNLPGVCWAYWNPLVKKSGTTQTVNACRAQGLNVDHSFWTVFRQQLGIDHLEDIA